MLEKAYDPAKVEDRIYAMWESAGAFKADSKSKKESFTVSMPPPNATGQLHLGHAVMLALEDIFTRFARMQGKEALWVPGTDHAAIATENVVIKKLQKEERMKDPRKQLGREKLVQRISDFVEESRGTIRGQVRKMGSSCDWSRERYTMEPTLNRCVNEVFTAMYKDGLIYRGHRIVNWDPKLQTTVSDDEIVYEERKDPFYTFKYGPFEISTSRPETKFGDKYVVMHPDDERYSQYKHGDTFTAEWINGPVKATIVKDKAVDPAFGTGVMTITPWHDHIDFEIAERHKLDKEQVIGFDGKLLAIAGEFSGLHIEDARPQIVEKLKSKGLLVGIKQDYVHNVSLSQRGKGMIEPQIKEQWFIDVNKPVVKWKRKEMSLKQIMQEVVKTGQIKIIPERFDKTYFNWVDNLRDWCISRQIWWGHRVPVWYDEKGSLYFPERRTFLFVRHGQTDGNAKKLCSGRHEHVLNDAGIAEAKALAKKLKSESKITRIIASPLKRTRATAEIIAKVLDLPVEYWDELQEIDYGKIEGLPKDENRLDLERSTEMKTGESLDDLEARARVVLQKLQSLDESTGDVLIVGHQSFSSVLFAVSKGVTSDGLVAFRKSWSFPNGTSRELHLPTFPGNKRFVQDSDTLDTWFSSAMWTWSTLVDQEIAKDHSLSLQDLLLGSPDFMKFHPTDVMETGYDILFFWVARMILMTTYVTGSIPELEYGQVPFDTVYLHGLIRTRDGRKMSKSDPDTMIDPLDMIKKYGADALRLSMIVGQSPGNDSRLYEEKIAGYRNFVNKLWNASRFVLMQCEEKGIDPQTIEKLPTLSSLSLADRAVLHASELLIAEVTSGLETYKLSEVGERIYAFVWEYFCDWYLELSKGSANVAVLIHVLRRILKLLHPYCPFVTEELWAQVKAKKAGMLILEEWPTVKAERKDQESFDALQIVINVITAIRKLRNDQNVEAKKEVDVILVSKKYCTLLESQESHIRRLGKIKSLMIGTDPDPKLKDVVSAFLDGVEVHLSLAGLVDLGKERENLEKEKTQLEKFLKGIQSKLDNIEFVKNAPPNVIELEREKEKSTAEKLRKIEERLQTLK